MRVQDRPDPYRQLRIDAHAARVEREMAALAKLPKEKRQNNGWLATRIIKACLPDVLVERIDRLNMEARNPGWTIG